MPADARIRGGLAGLLAFEALLLAYTLSIGSTAYAVMAATAAAALGWALARTWRGASPGAWPLAAVSGVTLVRALWQTVGGFVPAGLWATYLVPAGFALAAAAAAGRAPARAGLAGVAAMAAARTWFAYWYFALDNPTLAAANVVGAAGAWLWAAGASAPPAEAADELGVARG